MGVLVFQSTDIDLSEMRGYSLASQPLPVIVVNRKDSPAARQFTLLHELTHLMLHTSGLCDLEIGSGRRGAEHSTEVFCNHTAGAALVPRALLLSDPIVKSHRGIVWEDGELKSLAAAHSVSREVILRRLLIAGRTTQVFY
jgi:Zn-dependent peptidase ImmA (M78 family)